MVLPRAKGIKRKTPEEAPLRCRAWLPRDAMASDCWSKLRERKERQACGTSLRRGAFGYSADVCSMGQG